MVGDCAPKATLTPENTLACTESITPDRPEYPGPYEVMPAEDAQVLATSGLVMSSDVSVGGVGEAITDAVDGALATLVDGSYEGEYVNEEITTVNSYALATIPALTSVDLPAATTVGSSAFYGCTALTSVDLPAATTVGSSAFYGCTALTSVDLPAATTVGSSAFYGCTALTELTLPVARVCDTASLVNCTSLVRLVLPRLSYVGWTMARNCTSLKVFDTGAPSTLGDNGFQECTSLDTVIIRGTGRVVAMGIQTFRNTPINNGTGYIYVPRDLIEKYKVATNWATYADQFRAIEDYPDICDPDQGDN